MSRERFPGGVPDPEDMPSKKLEPTKEQLEEGKQVLQEFRNELEHARATTIEIDYPHWGKRDLWKVKDAVQLIAGLNPVADPTVYKPIYPEGKYGDRFLDSNKKFAVFKKIMQIVKEAIVIGTLKPFQDAEYHDTPWDEMRVYPQDFLVWAKYKEFYIPKELAHLLESKAVVQEPEEDGLDPRERTTLLQIIAVLAAEAELDLTKHSKAAGILLQKGGTHGLELPSKQDTIADKLKEARDLQKTR